MVTRFFFDTLSIPGRDADLVATHGKSSCEDAPCGNVTNPVSRLFLAPNVCYRPIESHTDPLAT
jgi:hypothetical protein